MIGGPYEPLTNPMKGNILYETFRLLAVGENLRNDCR